MFKIKGSCQIKITDSRTGETKQVIEKENLITNNALYKILGWSPRGVFHQYAIPYGNGYYTGYAVNIFISANTIPPDADATGVTIMDYAYTPNGVNKATFYPNANPIYGQIQQRINYTGTQRTFQTVGLAVKDGYGSFYGITAYLLLDTACVQGEYDYLDLFYRVQFINSEGQGLATRSALLDFAAGCFDQSTFNMQSYNSWVGVASTSFYERYGGASGISGSTSDSIDGNNFKFKMNFSADKDQSVGTIFTSMLQGSATKGGYHTLRNIINPRSPFQNIFTHSANATTPFFDSLTSAAGNGKIKTNGTWTGKFPELYKITMVTSGSVGTATYKYSIRKHLGFNGNTYSDLAFNSPYRIDLPSFHGMKEENNDLLRWSNTQIVQYDSTGVMLLDVYDGSYRIWDASTTSALTAATIRQCAVDSVNQKIYVGCRSTGLWVIDVANNAITQPISSPCYGVDVGRNAIAYALIEGGLYRSSDWSTPLIFNYTGVSDSNWNRVLFLKADPEHQSDRLCFVIAVPNQSNKIVWYEVSTNQISNGAQSSSIKSYPASVDVSDTGSFWASGAGKLTFGSTGLDSLGGELLTGNFFTHSVYGYDRYFKIAFYNSYLILRDRIVDVNGNTINAFSGFTQNSYEAGRSTILHLDSGICILSTFLRQMFTDNSYCWKNYGWDGSQWVLNHNGAKTTHSDTQLLNNGINIRFENGANPPHFISTDYFTQSICEGKHKDNASTISHNSAWYSVPVIFDAPINAIIPSSPTPPPAGSSWRIRTLNTPTGYRAWYQVCELYFKDANGVDLCTGGTASSNYNSGSAASAFDRNTVSYYRSEQYVASAGIVLQYNFPTVVSVSQVIVQLLTDGGSPTQPTQFVVESSLDNSNWVVIWSFDTGGNNNFTSIFSNYLVTVPAATNLDLRRMETDSPELHKLMIDGTPVTTVYSNSSDFYTSPGINEVWISSNGKIFFNPADANKVLSGTYSYLKY